ncbi:MBL fold metallo-hydrolase [Crocosphaera sp. Alani8]|uniref:MBL fold metallo-hydrolase n=1 Tax=Crocosphaera sp. Alani8 TaxID=3038952 RepID=UPI00313E6D30
MQLTWLDNNSWLIEISGKRILLDPWLTGSLVFGNLDWLFKGVKSKTHHLDKPVDLILLSQGLNDHAHIPTLKELDHNIPVVASPSGAKVVTELGYKNVETLDHGKIYTLDGTVEIKALPGSLVGPQLVENAYIITDLKQKEKLYYEPHGNHCSELSEEGNIDVILTPILGVSILHFLPVLQGQKTTLKLCQTLKPKVILPTADAKETEYKGVLAAILRQEGSIDKFRQQLRDNNLGTEVMTPKPGEVVNLEQLSLV